MLMHRTKRCCSPFISGDWEEDSEEVSNKDFRIGDDVEDRWYNMMLNTVELLTDDSDALLPFYFGGPRHARLARATECAALVEKLEGLCSDIENMCKERLLSEEHSAALHQKVTKKRVFLEEVLLLESLLFFEVSYEGTFLSCFSSLTRSRSTASNCMSRLCMKVDTFKSALENSCLLEDQIVQRGWLVLNFDEMPEELVAEKLNNKYRDPVIVVLKDMFRIQFIDFPVLDAEATHVCQRFTFNSDALMQVVKEAKEQQSQSSELRLHSWLLKLIDFMKKRKTTEVVNDENELYMAIWGQDYDRSIAYMKRRRGRTAE